MSTIPSGLRADRMRARMEDKATITATGGLYVGGLNAATYYNADGTTVEGGVETVMLPPGTAGLPLVSNGLGALPSYRQIGANAIPDHSIDSSKLGAGTVVDPTTNTQMRLNIYPDPNDSNVLVIEYKRVSY